MKKKKKKKSPLQNKVAMYRVCKKSISDGNNLHEMSNPVSWKKEKKKYFNMSSAENFTQSALSFKQDFSRRVLIAVWWP